MGRSVILLDFWFAKWNSSVKPPSRWAPLMTYQVAIRHTKEGDKGDKLRQDKKKEEVGGFGSWGG